MAEPTGYFLIVEITKGLLLLKHTHIYYTKLTSDMLATFTANQIVQQLLQQTFATAKSNIKIRGAIPAHSLSSVTAAQEELNLLLEFSAKQNMISLEGQPQHIEADSLMAPGVSEPVPPEHPKQLFPTKQSIKPQLKEPSGRQQLQTIKHTLRALPMPGQPPIDRWQAVLRLRKQEEERQRVVQTITTKKQPQKLPKGSLLVYDFEGSITAGKQMILNPPVNETTGLVAEQSHSRQMRILPPVSAPRKDSKKALSSGRTILQRQDPKQQILNSIKTQAGITLKIDGVLVSKPRLLASGKQSALRTRTEAEHNQTQNSSKITQSRARIYTQSGQRTSEQQIRHPVNWKPTDKQVLPMQKARNRLSSISQAHPRFESKE